MSECGLCGRPLRNRHWWNNWILGPYCNGKDLESCKELFIEQVVTMKIRGM